MTSIATQSDMIMRTGAIGSPDLYMYIVLLFVLRLPFVVINDNNTCKVPFHIVKFREIDIYIVHFKILQLLN